MIQFIYWLVNVGYAFKYHGLIVGLINCIVPYALIWDGLMWLIKTIHGGVQ